MPGHLAIDTVEVSGRPLAAAGLPAGQRLVVMGDAPDVAALLTQLDALPGTRRVPGPPADSRRRVRDYLHDLLPDKAAGTSGTDAAAALESFGLSASRLSRMRLRELDTETRTRLHMAAAVACGAPWPILDDPFAGLPGDLRAGIRGRLLAVCDQAGIGLILASSDLLDAATARGTAVVVERGQLADAGPLPRLLREPRSNLAAGFAGVNVFSGLARRGWLSIGHSQVRARTELDGKVFVTIPTDATTMSFDEFDPVFTSDTVFEALIVGIRDRGARLQIIVSPADTEVGLAMTADVLDFRAGTQPTAASGTDSTASGTEETTASGAEWGVLHPGLATSVAETLAAVRVGARVFIEVDTSRMHAYPVEVG